MTETIFNCAWCHPKVEGKENVYIDAREDRPLPLPGFSFTDGFCKYHKKEQKAKYLNIECNPRIFKELENQSTSPSERLFNGEKVLASELCAQARDTGQNLEFIGEIVTQHVLPFGGKKDFLFWREERRS